MSVEPKETTHIHGYAYSIHPLPEGKDKIEFLKEVVLWHTNQGHIVIEKLAYYNKDRDALTCPYHLLDVPGPNAEWGWEIKWQ